MRPEEIELKAIWAVELSILDEVDRLCRKNNLRYSLAYGTLIGAVRHQGFIPWDDDIDIMMPRDDYDRFMQLWIADPPDGFFLDRCENTPYGFNNFSKVRKDHSTFLQFEGDRNNSHHKGIFIDVFPGDRVAPGKLSRSVQAVFFLLNLLFNRGYRSGSGGFVGFAERFFLFVVPKRCYHKLSLFFGRRSRRWNSDSSLSFVFPSTVRDSRLYYPADLFDGLTEIPFAGKKYLAVRNADLALRIEYGDYMQLPPEEERVWKHSPILVDLNHNYEELTEAERFRPQSFVRAQTNAEGFLSNDAPRN